MSAGAWPGGPGSPGIPAEPAKGEGKEFCTAREESYWLFEDASKESGSLRPSVSPLCPASPGEPAKTKPMMYCWIGKKYSYLFIKISDNERLNSVCLPLSPLNPGSPLGPADPSRPLVPGRPSNPWSPEQIFIICCDCSSAEQHASFVDQSSRFCSPTLKPFLPSRPLRSHNTWGQRSAN